MTQTNQKTPFTPTTSTGRASYVESNGTFKEGLYIPNQTEEYTSDVGNIVTQIEPRQFEDITRSKFITSVKFCMEINSLFKPIFKDYYGCVLEANPSNPSGFALSISFSKGCNKTTAAEGAIDNLVERVYKSKGKAKIDNKYVQSLNNMMKQQQQQKATTFVLNEDTEEILLKYVRKDQLIVNKDGKKMLSPNVGPNISHFIVEKQEPTMQYGYNNGFIIVDTIRGLDPIAFIEEMFGTKDESGNSVVYSLSRLGPITPVNSIGGVYGSVSNFMLAINMYKEAEIARVYQEAGFMTYVTPSMAIVTA